MAEMRDYLGCKGHETMRLFHEKTFSRKTVTTQHPYGHE